MKTGLRLVPLKTAPKRNHQENWIKDMQEVDMLNHPTQSHWESLNSFPNPILLHQQENPTILYRIHHLVLPLTLLQWAMMHNHSSPCLAPKIKFFFLWKKKLQGKKKKKNFNFNNQDLKIAILLFFLLAYFFFSLFEFFFFGLSFFSSLWSSFFSCLCLFHLFFLG